jgi:hypothetical protein
MVPLWCLGQLGEDLAKVVRQGRVLLHPAFETLLEVVADRHRVTS